MMSWFTCECLLASLSTIVTTSITDQKNLSANFSCNLLPDNHRDKFQTNELVIHYRFLAGTWKDRPTDYQAEILQEPKKGINMTRKLFMFGASFSLQNTGQRPT